MAASAPTPTTSPGRSATCSTAGSERAMHLLRHGCLALLASLALGQAAELTVLEAGSAAQLTALGNEALMQGRFETAIEHYRRALGVDKTSFQALFNLALAHQQLGKDGEARRW